MDIDTILSMIGNPTRRRILEALVREPCYPFQLSKEMGVSQQAIMKNLDLLEKNGMVMSRQVTSTSGPMRAMYAPTSEFTLVIDMRNRMFVTNVIEGGDNEGKTIVPDMETLDAVRGGISSIDDEIRELDRARSSLIRKREQLIRAAMSKLDEGMTSTHRELMYRLLNEPGIPAEEIIREMSTIRGEMNRKLAEIAEAMRL